MARGVWPTVEPVLRAAQTAAKRATPPVGAAILWIGRSIWPRWWCRSRRCAADGPPARVRTLEQLGRRQSAHDHSAGRQWWTVRTLVATPFWRQACAQAAAAWLAVAQLPAALLERFAGQARDQIVGAALRAGWRRLTTGSAGLHVGLAACIAGWGQEEDRRGCAVAGAGGLDLGLRERGSRQGPNRHERIQVRIGTRSAGRICASSGGPGQLLGGPAAKGPTAARRARGSWPRAHWQPPRFSGEPVRIAAVETDRRAGCCARAASAAIRMGVLRSQGARPMPATSQGGRRAHPAGAAGAVTRRIQAWSVQLHYDNLRAQAPERNTNGTGGQFRRTRAFRRLFPGAGLAPAAAG
jgi:hypothetical protein